MSIQHINALPSELLMKILYDLPFDDLTKSCKEVCQRWESIVLKILDLGNKISRWMLPVPLIPSCQLLRRTYNFNIPPRIVKKKRHLHILIEAQLRVRKKVAFDNL